jgi:tetratricopeptide (TPR) repeat protein
VRKRFSNLLVLVVTLLCASQGARAATNDLFLRGVEAYRSGKFAEAANDLRAAAEELPATGTLVNLGLTEWRRGRAGAAIQAWEQAQWIDPFDSRARGNLRYARQLIGVESPDYAWFERASAWLPANAWAWIAGGSLWLAIGLVVLPGVFRWRKSSWQQAIAAVALAVFLASLPALAGVSTRTQLGFVLLKETPLRLSPTAEGESVAKLAAGESARKVRTRGDYVLVRTTHGRGWIESRQFGRLCPE